LENFLQVVPFRPEIDYDKLPPVAVFRISRKSAKRRRLKCKSHTTALHDSVFETK